MSAPLSRRVRVAIVRGEVEALVRSLDLCLADAQCAETDARYDRAVKDALAVIVAIAARFKKFARAYVPGDVKEGP